MSVTSQYKRAWESFWSEAPDDPGAVFWDAEPALTSGLHLALFEPHLMAADLPLVDLGCGNGTQTFFLAERLPRVTGVDLSAAALAHARRRDPLGAVPFREIDAADPGAVRRLHGELGDTHVYMRGVLHQCDPADRQPLIDSIATLVGERGRAFVVEPAEAAGAELSVLARRPAGPPPKLRPVLTHGIATGTVRDAALPQFIRAAGLSVLAQGELPLLTTEYVADGIRIALPSNWLVVGRTG
ncbi:class I SAM-dependent methyltransferase [Streptomyces sp. NBC_01433]|uniref:class I SAM-dependent methyltransferase n=1 Tax=Streptomyces sp. NBC_01433 TaxID=2903864 RepID=UPI002257C32A|nr:class I SAM-dependent methyltransferase [Streptomyces sp. NBC_01433]MCX4680232.1 class I SAM-dependent methyltransferase [Streptomyces sp. NBC_01433]